MPKPPAKKTARKTAPGRPFDAGADARRGGGKKGRSGRKTLEFKARCAELSDTLALEIVEAQLRAAVRLPNALADPATQFAVKYVTEYGQSKPSQAHEHTGANGDAIAHAVTVSFVGPTPTDAAR